MVSQVSTPKATGTPVARVTAASPAAAWPATWSKCGVAPRTTAPMATTAA